MFGYIVPNHMELKIREYEEYRGYYCGLCVCLKEKYGFFGRLTLNYDLVFLNLLLTALYEQPEKISLQKKFCILHPLKKRVLKRSNAASYAADMNMLLSYYKCMDDWNDERKVLRFLYAKIIKIKIKKIEKKYPEKMRAVSGLIDKLSGLENKNENNTDIVSGCFGEICRCVFAYHPDDEWGSLLGEFGYYIGKFIYLLDAYEDIKTDVKKGRYNVLANKYYELTEGEFKSWVQEILRITISQAGRIFERLPIVDNAEILRNIIYAGVWCRFEAVD